MATFTIFGSDGKSQIRNLDDWKRHGAPAKSTHWKQGRSAYETAASWLRGNRPSVPVEFMNIFRDAGFHNIEIISAIAERKTTFNDTNKGPRNHDLLIYANINSKKVIVGLEGKEREPYDKTVGERIEEAVKAASNSKLPARVHSFCRGILGRSYSRSYENIHYQFLSGIAGVAVEVKKNDAEFGVFAVQQIVTSQTPTNKIAYNDESYNSFVQLLDPTHKGDSSLIGPFALPGSALIPPVVIFIAKYKTYVQL